MVDQVSKVLVKTNMTLGESIYVLGDWFIIHFTENYGMAFGMEFSGEYGKLFLSLFRIVAVAFIGWYLHRLVGKRAHKGLIVCVSLIFAGALGNIIDSAFYGLIFNESHGQVAQFLPEEGGYGTFLHGKVVDMLHFPVITGTFPSWLPFFGDQPFIFFRPVFNIADAAITTGVFAVIIFQKKFFRLAEQQQPVETKPAETASGDVEPGEDRQTVEPGQTADEQQSGESRQSADAEPGKRPQPADTQHPSGKQENSESHQSAEKQGPAKE